MGKLFGTDGIRGEANKYPVNAETALALGRATAHHFAGKKHSPKIVVGKDTRISGDMIEHAVAAGICSTGADALLTGVLPTPAIACLTAALSADAGVVISASHNPYRDNGVKLVNNKGFKLSDEIENKIEKMILDGNTSSLCENVVKTGRVKIVENAEKFYIDFLKKSVPENFSLNGMKIAVDCSNGAASKIVPEPFSGMGADVAVIFNSPDGRNINENCGSQYTETLRETVVDTGADIGLAFDGDADRLICVDEKGNEIRGDRIMFICAKYLKKINRLKNNLLVTTVMSNIGLRLALRNLGIDHAAAKVGDRYVMEMMKERQASLGGEDSGHIIFLEHHTTGDGMLAALKLLEAVKDENKPLSELVNEMPLYPQALINVPVKNKPPLETLPEVVREIADAEKRLGEKGRVLVRYSGTELKCRVMVEGPAAGDTDELCRKIADAVANSIGA